MAAVPPAHSRPPGPAWCWCQDTLPFARTSLHCFPSMGLVLCLCHGLLAATHPAFPCRVLPFGAALPADDVGFFFHCLHFSHGLCPDACSVPLLPVWLAVHAVHGLPALLHCALLSNIPGLLLKNRLPNSFSVKCWLSLFASSSRCGKLPGRGTTLKVFVLPTRWISMPWRGGVVLESLRWDSSSQPCSPLYPCCFGALGLRLRVEVPPLDPGSPVFSSSVCDAGWTRVHSLAVAELPSVHLSTSSHELSSEITIFRSASVSSGFSKVPGLSKSVARIMVFACASGSRLSMQVFRAKVSASTVMSTSPSVTRASRTMVSASAAALYFISKS